MEIGAEETAMNIGEALQAAGYFVNVAVFPAVPRRRAGIRVMLNAHQTEADICGLVSSLAELSDGSPRSGRMRIQPVVDGDLDEQLSA